MEGPIPSLASNPPRTGNIVRINFTNQQDGGGLHIQVIIYEYFGFHEQVFYRFRAQVRPGDVVGRDDVIKDNKVWLWYLQDEFKKDH
ncbi:hypothetical protein OQA88_1452 [Cercophora sp. LCS_1]